ncbi:MAG: hypothetical protein M1834_001582 [Cirrosporium novae-zelandiae]|nr:MAG: hypothetical protein M1834_004099 [Cirrosporium novae-zelandiae]KAI9735566.1 MAG: hypothetical protein M1834_001582 [Cirrosporium novae-zelandiae]
MALFYDRDEELGKKDDDHHLHSNNSRAPAWSRWTGPHRLRRKRVLWMILGIGILYYLLVVTLPIIVNLTEGTRYPYSQPSDLGSSWNSPKPHIPGMIEPPKGPPPKDAAAQDLGKHYYNGQIKFYELASSLHGISRSRGIYEANRNVLFAASNLKSASTLITLACEMARWERSDVHFVFMGRDDIPMDYLKELNGVTDECDVSWHDARPDYSLWSTDYRMEVGIAAALHHINNFMHPQAIIIDESSAENRFFTKSMRSKARALGRTIIEIPTSAAENLLWVTKLDSASLHAWHEPDIELLIHAPVESSGSLIRLLKSIQQADYFGSAYPRITIELPQHVDNPTREFLENMAWPPETSDQPYSKLITLRHCIHQATASPTEASIRFVEGFYPTSPIKSHVVVLSPQAELSPTYFHYIKYHLLEYAYSTSRTFNLQSLIGISLELPSTQLNEKTPFTTPAPLEGSDEATSFLWQAPNSNAALYFGDKWAEFHSFLSNRLEAQRTHLPLDQRPAQRRKQVSERYPAWMEFLLELIRIRGFALLYPREDGNALVTIHNELYQVPEEFSAVKAADSKATEPLVSDPNEPFSVDASPYSPTLHTEPALLGAPLSSFIPSDKQLPELDSLPLLAYDGKAINATYAKQLSYDVRIAFRKEIGGCVNTKDKVAKPLRANDLFCLGDEDLEAEIELSQEDSGPALATLSAVSSSSTAPLSDATGIFIESEDALV